MHRAKRRHHRCCCHQQSHRARFRHKVFANINPFSSIVLSLMIICTSLVTTIHNCQCSNNVFFFKRNKMLLLSLFFSFFFSLANYRLIFFVSIIKVPLINQHRRTKQKQKTEKTKNPRLN